MKTRRVEEHEEAARSRWTAPDGGERVVDGGERAAARPFVRYGMWCFVIAAALSFGLTAFGLERAAAGGAKGPQRIDGVIVDAGRPLPEALLGRSEADDPGVGERGGSDIESRPEDIDASGMREGVGRAFGSQSENVNGSEGRERGGRAIGSQLDDVNGARGRERDVDTRLTGLYQKIRLESGVAVMLYMRNPGRLGDRVEGSAELRAASPPRNPGARSEKLWLRSHGASYVGVLTSGSVVPQEGRLLALRRLPAAARAHVWRACRPLFAGSAGAVTAALTMGETRLFSGEEKYYFNDSGIAHLTSISGTHMVFFLWPLRWLSRRGKRSAGRERALFFSVLWIPLLLAGWRTGIARATMLQALAPIDRDARRRRDHVNAVGWIGALLLVSDPFSVWQTGFWLSVMISLMLGVTGSAPGREAGGLRTPGHRFGAFSVAKFAGALKTSFYAGLTALPYQAMTSSGLFIGLPLVNAVAAVFAAWITVTGYAAVLVITVCAPFPGLARVLSSFFTFLITPAARALLSVASFGAKAHALHLPARSTGLLLAGLLLSSAVRRARSPRRKRGAVAAALLACALVFAGWCIAECRRRTVWRVLFADVGQGDATLIVSPEGRAYLIDGGDCGAGFYTLVPAMRSMGARVVDAAFLTHGHRDHAAGVAELLRAGLVRRIVVGGEGAPPDGARSPAAGLLPDRAAEDDLTAEVLGLAEERGVPVLRARQGDCFEADGARVLVISSSDRATDLNDRSLVLSVRLGGIQILFTGDISARTEAFLLEEGAEVRCDVLHVAHHGARSSNSARFLGAAGAQAAVISAGASNRFGHPHREVLERLEGARVTVFRTDRGGAVALLIQGGTCTMTSWAEEEK